MDRQVGGVVRGRATEVSKYLHDLGLRVVVCADLDPLVKTLKLGQVLLQNPTAEVKRYLQGLELREARSAAVDTVKNLHLGQVRLHVATEVKRNLQDLEDEEEGWALDKTEESHLAGVPWNQVTT